MGKSTSVPVLLAKLSGLVRLAAAGLLYAIWQLYRDGEGPE